MCSQRWLRNNALTNRSGAGRLCASGKQGTFPGVAAFRKQRKSYFTAQWMQAGLQFECCWFCNLPTPCRIKLLNSSSSIHSFFLPTLGKNNLISVAKWTSVTWIGFSLLVSVVVPCPSRKASRENESEFVNSTNSKNLVKAPFSTFFF